MKSIKSHPKPTVKLSSSPPRTQINLGGAPAGNKNAKKSLAWLESYDLTSAEGIRLFLVELIRRTWIGELGTRQAGALNGSMRLLLEHELLPQLERRIEIIEKGLKKN